jgi:hypothetical protein
MRHWFLIILAVFAVSCYLLAAYAQEDMSVIVNPVFGNPKRPPAVFEHDPHNELDIGRKPGLMKAFHTHCKSCHREKKKGPLMCGQCHLRQ